MMHKKLRLQHVALASMAALAITGCGGGNDDSAVGPGPAPGPVMVNAFAYIQPIVASGTSESSEPQAIDQIVLSSTDNEEPDTRL